MGKIKLRLKTENEELRETLEYLFMSSGYFELVGEIKKKKLSPNEYAEVEVKTSDVLEKGFSELLGDIMEDLSLTRASKGSLQLDGKISVLAIGSLVEGFRSEEVALSIASIIFARGHKPAYLSLKPINMDVRECGRNPMGFMRWLMDCRGKQMGVAERYVYDDGAQVFVGVPAYNPNAGDVLLDDVINLLKVLEPVGVDFLIIDIGTSLDLERERIFLSSDLPLLILEDKETDEAILHKYFEGAMPLVSTETKERKLCELIDFLEKHMESDYE